MLIAHTWSRFIAIIAFTSAIVCGITVNAVYPGGLVELPPITIGTRTFVVSLITAGIVPGLVYGISNTLDAFAPQVSPAFNWLSKIGSWFAFLAFSFAIAFSFFRWMIEGAVMERVFAAQGAYILIVCLWLFSVADVSWFQRRKNRSLAQHVLGQNTLVGAPALVQEQTVANGPLSYRGAPLIGHADRAQIMYFDAAGGDLDIEFEGGAPRRLRVTHQVAPERDAA